MWRTVKVLLRAVLKGFILFIYQDQSYAGFKAVLKGQFTPKIINAYLPVVLFIHLDYL